MKLAFPTSFGESEFFTIVELKDLSIYNVSVIKSQNKISTPPLNSGILMVKTPSENKNFSVADLNNFFIGNQEKINNEIDKFINNERK